MSGAVCVITNCRRSALGGEALCAQHRAAEAWDNVYKGMQRFGMESDDIETVSEYFDTPAPDKLDAATIERLLDPWRRVWMVAFEPFDNGPGEGVGRHAEDAGVADLLPKAWPTIADLRVLATDPHQHGGKA